MEVWVVKVGAGLTGALDVEAEVGEVALARRSRTGSVHLGGFLLRTRKGSKKTPEDQRPLACWFWRHVVDQDTTRWDVKVKG